MRFATRYELQQDCRDLGKRMRRSALYICAFVCLAVPGLMAGGVGVLGAAVFLGAAGVEGLRLGTLYAERSRRMQAIRDRTRAL